MRRRPLLFIVLLGISAACSAACSDDRTGIDAGPQPVFNMGGDLYEGPGQPVALLRFGNFALGLGFVDFCVAPHGGSFDGPLLRGRGLLSGIGDATVSQSLPIAAGQSDIRVVPGGASDCQRPVPPLSDFTSLPSLTAGQSYTVVLALQGGPTLQVFPDDSGPVPAGLVQLRFLNIDSQGPATLDFGPLGDGGFTPWIQGLPPLSIPQGPGIDFNGYLLLDAPVGTLSIQSGGGDLLDLLGAEDLTAGDRLSLFSLPAAVGQDVAALLCDDLFAVGSSARCVLYPLPGEPAVADGG